MKIRIKTKLKEQEINKIIEEMGLNLISSKNYFKLKTSSNFMLYNLAKKETKSPCLHAHFIFMINILKKDIDAVFYTKFGTITKNNIKNFYKMLMTLNIGTYSNIYYYYQACNCNKTIHLNIMDLFYELNNNLFRRKGGF